MTTTTTTTPIPLPDDIDSLTNDGLRDVCRLWKKLGKLSALKDEPTGREIADANKETCKSILDGTWTKPEPEPEPATTDDVAAAFDAYLDQSAYCQGEGHFSANA